MNNPEDFEILKSKPSSGSTTPRISITEAASTPSSYAHIIGQFSRDDIRKIYKFGDVIGTGTYGQVK